MPAKINKVNVRWRGDQYEKVMFAHIERNLDSAATFLVGYIRASFGSAPPEPEAGTGWRREWRKHVRATNRIRARSRRERRRGANAQRAQSENANVED